MNLYIWCCVNRVYLIDILWYNTYIYIYIQYIYIQYISLFPLSILTSGFSGFDRLHSSNSCSVCRWDGRIKYFPCVSSYRKLPCSSSGSDWFTPSVDQSVVDFFLNGNWSMSNPSPSCQCSTPERTTMLPDCPPGAGGLPPPQVSFLN